MYHRRHTRREFLHRSATLALATQIPFSNNTAYHQAVARAGLHAQPADSDTVRALALRAIDAARAAGATYADVRLTRLVSELFLGAGLYSDGEELGIGVRALVNGAWGFAASPVWTADTAARLARTAVAEATENARAGLRSVEMGHTPAVTGSWNTPIQIDPFQISLEEKIDYVISLVGLAPAHVPNRMIAGGADSLAFTRIERAIATTDGSFVTQTLYESGGQFELSIKKTKDGIPTGENRGVSGRGLATAGAGWELIRDANIPAQIPHLIDEAEALFPIPTKPVDVGRYEIVCDASTMASLVEATLGNATQLDVCLGYEANAGGTSFLGPDPLAYLGTALSTPLVNLRGDRSMPQGLATVKWDDECVEPEPFAIVEQGMLVDYQTTREQAAWLKDWYAKRGRPIRSHGCALGMTALELPIQRIPNLSLLPGATQDTFDDLVANTSRGIAVIGGACSTDFQFRNGAVGGVMREIVNGKLGAFIQGSQISFNTMELWKKFHAIGGPSSRAQVAMFGKKGEPAQAAYHTVAAVPGAFKDLSVVDAMRAG